jgi:hypothetical protein
MKGDEISTCGNRLWMNFSDALKSAKSPRNSRRIFFEKKA